MEIGKHIVEHQIGGKFLIEHSNISGVGTNTHPNIDTHIATVSTSSVTPENPHDVRTELSIQPSGGNVWYDDFLISGLHSDLIESFIGRKANASNQRAGAWRFRTSGSQPLTNNFMQLGDYNGVNEPWTPSLNCECQQRVRHVNIATAENSLSVGFTNTDNVLVSLQRAIFYAISGTNSGNWQCITTNGADEEITSTAITSSSYRHMHTQMFPGSVVFLQGETVLTTHSGASVPTSGLFCWQLLSFGPVLTSNIDIDYLLVRQNRT